MTSAEFTEELLAWQGQLVADLDAALAERQVLVAQIDAAKAAETAIEEEQRRIETLVIDATGWKNSMSGFLRLRIQNRRRGIPRPESPRLTATLELLDYKIIDFRAALAQIGRAITGQKFDAPIEREPAVPTPEPAVGQIVDDGLDIVWPTFASNRAAARGPVTDLEIDP